MNNRKEKDFDEKKRKGRNRGKRNRNADYDKERSQERGVSTSKGDSMLDPTGRDNDPNWYFTDAMLAEQVSQLSFQSLAGLPIDFSGKQWDVPNIVRISMNPCPGVIKTDDYSNTLLNRNSGLNLAGFRIFSKLSAFTGRIASYGPQDISTMILAMGEVISTMEWCRRAFGVANAMSMRNRSYPREVLRWGMLLDDDDLMKNYAVYRTRFNGLVTLVNQLPIPKGIAYFEKCAALYEKIYLDANSSMAQSIILNPFSTWVLDETSNPAGSVLATTPWHMKGTAGTDCIVLTPNPRTMGDYLDICDKLIGALLNSSTLQVVYTDLLNLAVKVGQEFWKLDYIADGYLVVPEYNEYVLLQLHNATITSAPADTAGQTSPHVTKLNDVDPNPNSNSVYYNPGFRTLNNLAGGPPRTGADVLIDMMSDHPDVVDRVEVTRYTSISGDHYYLSDKYMCDAILPDHYVVGVSFSYQTNRGSFVDGSLEWNDNTFIEAQYYNIIASAASQIQWFPHFYEIENGTTNLTGNYCGDLNFYTTVEGKYLRRLHQFMTLGLYDLRSGKLSNKAK